MSAELGVVLAAKVGATGEVKDGILDLMGIASEFCSLNLAQPKDGTFYLIGESVAIREELELDSDLTR